MENNEFSIKVKLAEKDYIKLLLKLAYSNPAVIFITAVGALILVTICIMIYRDGFSFVNMFTYPMVVYVLSSLLFLVYCPFVMWYRAKRNFKMHPIMQYESTYTFSDSCFKSKSDHSSSNVEWDLFFSFKEMNDWYILYTTRYSAIFIPKSNLSAEQVVELRNILKSHPNVKQKLLKNGGTRQI